jgi:hypothetical protein
VRGGGSPARQGLCAMASPVPYWKLTLIYGLRFVKAAS